MREDLIGTTTGWTPAPLDPGIVSLFLDATQLDVAPFALGDAAHAPVLPPAILAALRPDADALGIPQDAPVRLNAGNRFSWQQPVHLGTPLERKTVVSDAYEKLGSSGRLEFYVLDSVFRRKDEGSTVAEARSTTIRRYPSEVEPNRAPGRARRPSAIPAGRDLVPVEFSPTSRQLVKYSAATGDFYEAHYDHLYAIEQGLPGVIVHGLLKLCFATRALHDWFGPTSFIQEIDVQYRGLDLVGQPWTVHGTVSEAPGAPGQAQVAIEGVSADGARTVEGSASVGSLPEP